MSVWTNRRGEALTRRHALCAAGAAVFAAMAPRMVVADEAAVAAAIKSLYADKPMASGRIKLGVPSIAENGALVPIAIDVDSPMTDADFVKAVHVFADGNPLPNVVTYRFAPAAGRASASTRMRLAQSQDIICIAEMSNGTLFSAKANVKVTIGGCGG